MADPRKFITNTDYPMPFLVYSATYQITIPANSSSTQTEAHGLPFTPLLIGQWSTNSSFQPSYDIALEIPTFAGYTPEMTMVVGADGTNIHFIYSNYTSSSKTVYFRLTAFAPPSYTGQVTAIDDNSSFKYNSDFNYMKIYVHSYYLTSLVNLSFCGLRRGFPDKICIASVAFILGFFKIYMIGRFFESQRLAAQFSSEPEDLPLHWYHLFVAII